MLVVFPNRLDALNEEVQGGALRHVTRSLHVRVHIPELVDVVEVCQSLDVLFVPTIRLVLSIKSVRVAQRSTNSELD